MRSQARTILIYFTLIIVSLYFLFLGLVQAKSFLSPLAIAALLAMVMLPVCRWLEGKGINRGLAALFSDLIILLFFIALTWVVGTQIKSFSQDWPQIKDRLEPKIEQLQGFIQQKTGLSVQEQDRKLSDKLPGSPFSSKQPAPDSVQNQQTEQDTTRQVQQPGINTGSSTSTGSVMTKVGSVVAGFISFLGNFLLTFIYIFFLLLYRSKFRKAILKMVSDDKRKKAQEIIKEAASTSQNYLFGRLILIIFLAILYGVGLSISGVKNAILISILASVLSLVPYIGNIIGYGLAIGMAIFSGSGLSGAIGVSITFAVAQFVESYILEPYVVGDKVDVSPVFTIIVVVLGGAVWGITGMLVAIPALGIIKVICDHVPVLNPLGYLFGAEDSQEQDDDKDNIFKKTKRWALNKFK